MNDIINKNIIKPQISVLICTYNVQDVIKQTIDCINSVCSKKYSTYEIILIDDKSSDNTANIAGSIALPQLKVYRNNQSIGLEKSMLLGTKFCTSPNIMKINADSREVLNISNQNTSKPIYQNDNQQNNIIISVIIIAKNKPQNLIKALNSFAEQTCDKSLFEVIVVDNGSAIKLKDTANQFRDKINLVYLDKEDKGIAAAMNEGIKCANGQIVLFSDDKKSADKNLIDEHIKIHCDNRYEEVAVVGRLAWESSIKQDLFTSYLDNSGQEYLGCSKLKNAYSYDLWDWSCYQISIKKSILCLLDYPFDAELKAGYYDVDFVCRLLEKQKKLRVIHNAAALGYIIEKPQYLEICSSRQQKGRDLSIVQKKFPDLLNSRYKLQNAALEYNTNYMQNLENWSKKAQEYTVISSQLANNSDINIIKSIFKLYEETLKGYLLKGFVENQNTVIVAPKKVEPLQASSGKKIIFFCPQVPTYDKGSSNFRIFNIVKILSEKGYCIEFAHHSDGEKDPKYKNQFNQNVKFVHIPLQNQKIENYIKSQDADSIGWVWITNIWNAANMESTELIIDICRKYLPNTKVIADIMDFLSRKAQRVYEYSKDPMELYRAKNYFQIEQRLFPKADTVVVVTDSEKDAIKQSINCNVEVVSNIHPIADFDADFNMRKNICFIGSLGLNHNYNAIKWFAENIWNTIYQQSPDTQFQILGFNNDKFKDEFEKFPNFKVVGYVHDAEQAISQYKVFVCPMVFGSGMKGKLGSAAIAGTPIVSTSVGTESMPFQDGQNCYIADEPQIFAQKTLQLLKDSQTWQGFSTNAKNMVIENYSPNAVSDMLDKVLGQTSANSQTPNPQFSFVMIVLNGMPFIEYSLKSIYDFAKEIIIVEGAVEKCLFAANPDGSSKDGTVEFIKNFPDPQNKIKLIQGKFPEKCEMQNEALKYATGNYIWLIDSDEVYNRQDLQKINNIIKNDPQIAQVNLIPDNFWKGFDYIFESKKFYDIEGYHYKRIFKFAPGAKFISHRPPTMVLPGSDKTTEQMKLLDGWTTRKMGIKMYHYSYVLPEQVLQKIELYKRYGWEKGWKISADEWFNECYLKWTHPNRKMIEQKYPIWTGDKNSYTLQFTGSHPEVMRDYFVNSSKIKLNDGSTAYAMQPIIDAVNEIKTMFAGEPILAIETGTIRTYGERHFSTYHIARNLNRQDKLISVDFNKLSIHRSKNICYDLENVEFVLSDSHKYLGNLTDEKFHIAFLDSSNKGDFIFEEFKLVWHRIIENGILMIDDSGILPDGSDIDHSVTAKKAHTVWRFLKEAGVKFKIVQTPMGHGTQLKLYMTNEVIHQIGRAFNGYAGAKTESKKLKVAEDYVKSGIAVDTESTFGQSIKEVFTKIQPRKIIECGTYRGTGTTTIIANTLKELGINDYVFCTIEVNPQNYQLAVDYFRKNNINVKALNGLSLPRTMLPNADQIENDTIKNVVGDNIFVDHQESRRVQRYLQETDFPDVPDDLLGKCLNVMKNQPDFVLLDSGAHIGYAEFRYLIDNLKGQCYIALDDIYHIKHYRSFQYIKSDNRFKLIKESKEKFGYCIVLFNPAVQNQEIDNLKSNDSPASFDNENVKKVLLLRTDSLGDFVIFTDVLPYYRKMFANSRLDIAVRSGTEQLAQLCDGIDNVITHDRKKMVYDEQYALDFINKIRAEKYDIVINTLYSRDKVSDFIAINSGAKQIIGCLGDTTNISQQQLNENSKHYTKLLTMSSEPKIETERNREFLKGLGVEASGNIQTNVAIQQQDVDFAELFYQDNSISDAILLAPFGQFDFRTWQIDNWIKLLQMYQDQTFIITGVSDDYDKAEEIISRLNGIKIYNICGKTTVPQLTALIAKSKLCITAESAPAHIAAAVNVKHIVLIGGGHFGRFMPYSDDTILVYNKIGCYNCNWICKDKKYECIQSIAVDQVAQKVNQILQPSSTVNSDSSYLVSAIVSTYNSEKYFKGCLDDLIAQTLYQKGQLEILVVNSNSQQNEDAVIQPYLKNYQNIKYIKTPQRETIYKAWNRAIQAANGKYITNANTDDRHNPEALETLANVLDTNPNKAVVYANQQLYCYDQQGSEIVTGVRVGSPFNRQLLFDGKCPPGSQPMWRASLHNEFGLFDDTFIVGGDTEFWFRVSQKYDFEFVSEILGRRYNGEEAVSKSSKDLSRYEGAAILQCYDYAAATKKIIYSPITQTEPFCNWAEIKMLRDRQKAKITGQEPTLAEHIKVLDNRKSENPAVSVLVVADVNDSKYQQTIDSINRQTFKDYEIIAVSVDNMINFENTCNIIFDCNMGKGYIRKTASVFAKGSYLVFVDSGTILNENCLERTVNHLQNDDIIGLRGKIIPQKGIVSEGFDLGERKIESLCSIDIFAAFKRDIYEQAGGYAPEFTAINTPELLYRIYKNIGSNKFYYYPDVIVGKHIFLTDPAEEKIRQEYMHYLSWKKDRDITLFCEGGYLNLKPQDIEQDQTDKEFLVSAIVSTYNSEKFIKGCLDDLVEQSLYRVGQLEIVIVNSGSQQNEDEIIQEYKEKYKNITSLKTDNREGLYTAWNRAIKLASGKYITNANTDDRHHKDCMKILAEALDKNPDAVLAYSDQIITDTENAILDKCNVVEYAKRPDFTRQRLLLGCCVGSQPMWRKSVHNEFGYFDESLTCAADWDFWCKISEKYKFIHIPQFLGLYLKNEDGIENGKKIHSLYERYAVGKRYGTEYISVIPYHTPSETDPLVSIIMPAYNSSKYIAESIESVLIQNYPKFELIIVDDGSTDDTAKIAQSFNDQRVKLIQTENKGASSARNTAIKNAVGVFIVPLDSDDMMSPDFILEHIKTFQANLQAALVYCDDMLIDENSKPINIMNKPEYSSNQEFIRDMFRLGHAPVNFRTMIKKAVLDKIGLYDTGLIIGEDYDMMRRFVKTGFEFKHLPLPCIFRRMQADSLSRTPAREKAVSHFDVVQRVADTFECRQLFPDVDWNSIPQSQWDVHTDILKGATWIGLVSRYAETNQAVMAAEAFERAQKTLNNCRKIMPDNAAVNQLWQKCQAYEKILTR